MDVPCRIELLGGLRVYQTDRLITRFLTHKVGGLLAYLALQLGKRQPREVLVELFWPGEETGAGRRSLRVALASLRKQLEPPGVPPG
jgi:DNA-binding SARP family transcriptional activator